jgi:hypothetical protein
MTTVMKRTKPMGMMQKETTAKKNNKKTTKNSATITRKRQL